MKSSIISPVTSLAFLLAWGVSALFPGNVFSQPFVEKVQNITFDFVTSPIGNSVVSLGDFFGDGSAYIAFGEPGAEGGGAVWLVGGGDLLSGPDHFRIPDRGRDIPDLSSGDEFGQSLAVIDDLDGNGIPELAVGAPGEELDDTVPKGSVRVLFFDEDKNLIRTLKITEGAPGFDFDLTSFGRFGEAVAGITGITGPGETMIMIGAPEQGERGFVYLCILAAKGIEKCRRETIESDSINGDAFGSAIQQISPMPTENSPFARVAIGAPEYHRNYQNLGQIHVVSVNVVNNIILYIHHDEITGEIPGSLRYGARIAAPGDLNGDGVADLILGNPNRGEVRLLFLDPNRNVLRTLFYKPSINAFGGHGSGIALLPSPTGALPKILLGSLRDGENGGFRLLSIFDPLPPVPGDDQYWIQEDESITFSVFENDMLSGLPPYFTIRYSTPNSTLTPAALNLDELFTFIPDEDFFGQEKIIYRLFESRKDESGSRAFGQATITVNVAPVEDPPKISELFVTTAPVDNLFNQTVTVREVDGQPLTADIIKKPDWLAVSSVVDSVSAAYTFVGTPTEAEIGPHEIIVEGADGTSTTIKSFIVTVPAEALPVPEPLTPDDGATNLPYTSTLAWLPVDAATRYLVQLSPDAGFSTIELAATSIGTTHEFTDLRPETTYYWRVQAVNDNAASPFSRIFSFTTEPNPFAVLAAPQLLAPADGSSGQAISTTLAWEPVTLANLYGVQVAADSSFENLYIDTFVEEPVFQLNGLAPGLTYYWRIQGTNDNALGEYSRPFRFSTALGVGIEDAALPVKTRLLQNYPNPFISQTVIPYELAEAGHISLAVYDMLGREVQQLVDAWQAEGRYDVVFEAGDLPSGMYLYRISIGTRYIVSVRPRRMVLLH